MERGERGASVFLHAGMSTGLFHFHFPSSSPHTPHLKVFFFFIIQEDFLRQYSYENRMGREPELF